MESDTVNVQEASAETSGASASARWAVSVKVLSRSAVSGISVRCRSLQSLTPPANSGEMDHSNTTLEEMWKSWASTSNSRPIRTSFVAPQDRATNTRKGSMVKSSIAQLEPRLEMQNDETAWSGASVGTTVQGTALLPTVLGAQVAKSLPSARKSRRMAASLASEASLAVKDTAPMPLVSSVCSASVPRWAAGTPRRASAGLLVAICGLPRAER